MAWSTPRTWVAGEIVTADIMNTHVKNQLRYLKGLDGVPTVESGLTIDNTDGDERLLLPLLSTAECTTVLNAEGEFAFDETLHRLKFYDGTAVRMAVGTSDVDDTPADGATTDPVSSNWAYDFINTLTTQADLPYATAAGTWTRLPKGTAGQRLRMNAGATAPEWAATGQTMQFFLVPTAGVAGAAYAQGDHYTYRLEQANDYVHFEFRIPADFTTLTSAKVCLIPLTTGTFDWTVTTDFAANGETCATHSDSATADGQAVTNLIILELDVSAALTGLAANDVVGMIFNCDALSTTTGLGILGLDIKYT